MCFVLVLPIKPLENSLILSMRVFTLFLCVSKCLALVATTGTIFISHLIGSYYVVRLSLFVLLLVNNARF